MPSDQNNAYPKQKPKHAHSVKEGSIYRLTGRIRWRNRAQLGQLPLAPRQHSPDGINMPTAGSGPKTASLPCKTTSLHNNANYQCFWLLLAGVIPSLSSTAALHLWTKTQSFRWQNASLPLVDICTALFSRLGEIWYRKRSTRGRTLCEVLRLYGSGCVLYFHMATGT